VRYSRIFLIGIPVGATGWWLFERLHINFSYILPLSWEYNLLVVILLISVAFTLFSSVYTMLITTGDTRNRIISGQWESLRATPLGEQNIVEAYDVIAQIRSWRFSVIEVGLRLAVALLFMLDGYYSLWFTYAQNLSGYLGTTIFNLFFWIGTAIEILIFLAIAVEPLYRVRMIIACSLAIGVRVRNSTHAILAGSGVVLFTHLLHIGSVSAIYNGVLSIGNTPSDDGATSVALMLAIDCVLAAAGFYFLYRVLRNRILSSITFPNRFIETAP
jgi:hypothetical protein